MNECNSSRPEERRPVPNDGRRRIRTRIHAPSPLQNLGHAGNEVVNVSASTGDRNPRIVTPIKTRLLIKLQLGSGF